MGGNDGSQQQFTGLAKYFNSYTDFGRRNWVFATYGGLAVIFLLFKLKTKKKPAVTEK